MSGMSICGYLWLSFLVIWLLWAFATKRTQTRERLVSRIPYLVLTVAAFYAMFSHDVASDWLRLRILPREFRDRKSRNCPHRRRSAVRDLGQGLPRPQLEWQRYNQGRPRTYSLRAVSLGAPSDLLRNDPGHDRHRDKQRPAPWLHRRCAALDWLFPEEPDRGAVHGDHLRSRVRAVQPKHRSDYSAVEVVTGAPPNQILLLTAEGNQVRPAEILPTRD